MKLGCNQKYRHEYKFLISDLEKNIIEYRLMSIMNYDTHVGLNHKYVISSLYFDDIYDSCFYENENGTDPREKFRIRKYNNSNDRISLECKRKERGKTLKTSCSITDKQVEDIIKGKPVLDADSPELLKKLYYLIQTKRYTPKVIVEYERMPFVYKLGNVRITIDMLLSSSTDVNGFLTGNYRKRPVMPSDTYLLEVKFDEFLPEFIRDVLQINTLSQTAYSKYYLCRKYSEGMEKKYVFD